MARELYFFSQRIWQRLCCEGRFVALSLMRTGRRYAPWVQGLAEEGKYVRELTKFYYVQY